MILNPILSDLIHDLRVRRSGSDARMLSDLQWLQDHCTIRLNAGRRAGHTTAIVQLFQPDFDTAIVGNGMWKREFERNGIRPERTFVKSIDGPLTRSRKNPLIQSNSVVWVDSMSWWCKEKELESIYFSIIGEAAYLYGEDRAKHYPVIVLLG